MSKEYKFILNMRIILYVYLQKYYSYYKNKQIFQTQRYFYFN